MPRREGDESGEPEGGRAAERFRQFREARDPSPAADEDTEALQVEETTRDEQGGPEQESADQEPASPDDRDEDSSD